MVVLNILHTDWIGIPHSGIIDFNVFGFPRYTESYQVCEAIADKSQLYAEVTGLFFCTALAVFRFGIPQVFLKNQFR